MKRCLFILTFFSSFCYLSIFADTVKENSQSNLEYPWSVLFYAGKMTENTLGQIFGLNIKSNPETLYSLELSHTLAPSNPFRRFFQPIVSTVEVVGNVTYRNDPVGPIYEFDPYVAFRWNHFPWNKTLLTSFAIGEGISFATDIPQAELRHSTEGQGILNYLMFEATVAMPSHPQWELVLRLHHRSGVYGLYDAGNNGSTAVGLGIRYRF